MTEVEWLTTNRPARLEEHVRKAGLSGRKHLLFAAACCRLVAKWIVDPRSWIAVETAEEIADADDDSWQDRAILARGAAYEAHVSFAKPNRFQWASWIPVAILDAADAWKLGRARWNNVQTIMLMVRGAEDHLDDLEWERYLNPDLPGQLTDHPPQANAIRDIFGNPFRPVAFDPRWQSSTAVGLARTMYDARDFGAMPILADALQDAGCEDDAILSHCRDAKQVHVRGCWVVDLVLDKS